MPTTISKNSIETVTVLIRSAFDKTNTVWGLEQAKEYIKTAKEYSLTELALEMENDLI